MKRIFFIKMRLLRIALKIIREITNSNIDIVVDDFSVKKFNELYLINLAEITSVFDLDSGNCYFFYQMRPISESRLRQEICLLDIKVCYFYLLIYVITSLIADYNVMYLDSLVNRLISSEIESYLKPLRVEILIEKFSDKSFYSDIQSEEYFVLK